MRRDPIVFVALVVFTSWIVHVIGTITLPDIKISDSGSLTASDIATIVSAVATIIIARIMWVTVRVTQRLEKEKRRPRIVFDFDFDQDDKHLYVEVRNEGLTSATDINFEIPDEIKEVGRYKTPKEGEREFAFVYPISFLSPSDKKKTLLTPEGVKFLNSQKELVFEVGVSYTDAMDKDNEKYKETITHDLTYVKNITWVRGTTTLEKIDQKIRALDYTLQKIERSLTSTLHSPPPLRVGISRDSYSRKALMVAKWFVKNSKTGIKFDPWPRLKKIVDETDLTESGVLEAISELEDKGFVKHEARNLMEESQVTPEEILFVEFDRFWMDWDTEEDAKRVAKGIWDEVSAYESKDHSIKEPVKLMRQIADLHGWSPRRLNPALCWLEKRKLVTLRRGWWSRPFVCHAIDIYRASLSRFVKNHTTDPLPDDNDSTKEDDQSNRQRCRN